MLFGQPDEFPVDRFRVRPAHIREPRAQLIVVFSDKRIVAQKIDVVGKQHQLAFRKIRIHRASGIGNDQITDAQKFHHPHRKGDLLHGVPFVIMKPSFHNNYHLSVQPSVNQLSVMKLDGGLGEIGNVGIINLFFDFDFIGQFPQSGTENDPCFRIVDSLLF